jgi:Asp-tRNA(Asn)/Glu-tRNA(Gln) amidotransferase A subunit family amidase
MTRSADASAALERPETDVSRRHFLAGAALLAVPEIARPAVPPGPATVSSDITTATIEEAEKIHAVKFSPEARAQLVAAIPAQIAAVKAVRAVARPRSTKPAIVFDPRLPGVAYPAQENRLALAPFDPGPVPTNPADLGFASTRAQSHWIHTRQLTSRRLTELYLERIRRLAPPLFCYITVTEELALRQADAADRDLALGRDHGPLHGIPYAIKDSFDTAGIATTYGSALFRDRVPTEDAVIVTKLREAGAVLLGKLALGALGNGETWFGGRCRNPWNPAESSGGSSAGSGSATAAGLCSFSIGTDALGSILNPADRCGIVGLRPTFGRVPRQGGMPLTSSLSRVGPLTRTVEDAALVLAAIHGPDTSLAPVIDQGFSYDATIDPSRLRIGYSPTWFERVGIGADSIPATAAHRAALAALESLGAELVTIELPAYPYFALINNLMVEAAAVYEDLTLTGKDGQLPADESLSWGANWRQARLLSAVDYLQFERMRRQIMVDFHELFFRVDALFGPTYGSFDLIVATNFTGHPGITLRAGFDRSAARPGGWAPGSTGPVVPITQNVALHGRLYQEGTILAIARALEAKLGVAHHRPPVDPV